LPLASDGAASLDGAAFFAGFAVGLDGCAPAEACASSVVVESSEDAIITKNDDAIITSWNDAAARMYGYSREEAVGRPISILIPPERSGEEFEILRTVLKGEAIEQYETERVSKDGRRLTVSLSVSPIRDKYGDVVGAAAIARDVTERKRMERQLHYLAHHDALTGIYNRGRFQEELEQWLRYAERYQRSGAILLLDLDDFKVVNDTWGHAAGDALLQRVASALREHTRDSDIVARMGGDEFAVLLSEVDAEGAMRVAQKLLENVCCHWEGTSISAGIGVPQPFRPLSMSILRSSARFNARRSSGSVHGEPGLFSLNTPEMTDGMLTRVTFTPEHLARAKENLSRVDAVGAVARDSSDQGSTPARPSGGTSITLSSIASVMLAAP